MALYTARGIQTITASVSSGWTTFSPSVDTQITYVSQSTGNDGTGVIGDINHPFKTIAAGISQLRDTKPDWLLLKKGDTWTGESFSGFSLNGRSSTEPMVIGSYDPSQPGVVNPTSVGKARPMLSTTAADFVFGTTSSSTGCNNLALTGIEFYPPWLDPGSGSYTGPGAFDASGLFILNQNLTWFLMEDCRWSFYAGNDIENQTGNFNYILRRNVITDQISNGLYIQNAQHITFYQNFYDNNGKPFNTHNRNVYIEQHCGTDITATEEISTNSSSEGVQYRTGGVITNGLYVQNTMGFDLGHQLDSDLAPAIHTATVTMNVIMQSLDGNVGADGPRSRGINMLQCASTGAGIHVNSNIISTITSPGGDDASFGIGLDGNCSNCDVTNNIVWKWDSGAGNVGISDNGTGDTITPNTINMAGSGGGFPDPNRTVATYMTSIGQSPATLAGFIAKCKLQSKDNWSDQYTAGVVNNYIRAGFGL